jgi:hypothetical protein
MCGPIRERDLAGTDDGARTSTGAGLDSSAALVRAESDHVDGTLRALIARMSSVPGLKVSVADRHGNLRRLLGDLPYINDLNRRTGPIQRLVVAVGTRSYWVHADHGQIRCGREITLGEHWQVTEEMSFSIWARTLFGEIAVQNLVNYESMLALRRLVGQDRVD